MEKPGGNWLARLLKKLRIRQLVFICAGLLLLLILYHGAQMARGAPVDEIVEAIGDLGMLSFFLAMAVLPTVGFPVTPFYLLAGATFGIWLSLAGTAVAQALNLVLAYWLSRRYLRSIIERLVRKANYKIPEVRSKNYVNFTILVKITPGPPNFLKSFILGLARIPFSIFFVVSWPITMCYAIGVIIFGDSLADGEPLQAVGGVLLMIAFLIGVRALGNAISKRHELAEAVREMNAEDDSEEEIREEG